MGYNLVYYVLSDLILVTLAYSNLFSLFLFVPVPGVDPCYSFTWDFIQFQLCIGVWMSLGVGVCVCISVCGGSGCSLRVVCTFVCAVYACVVWVSIALPT